MIWFWHSGLVRRDPNSQNLRSRDESFKRTKQGWAMLSMISQSEDVYMDWFKGNTWTGTMEFTTFSVGVLDDFFSSTNPLRTEGRPFAARVLHEADECRWYQMTMISTFGGYPIWVDKPRSHREHLFHSMFMHVLFSLRPPLHSISMTSRPQGLVCINSSRLSRSFQVVHHWAQSAHELASPGGPRLLRLPLQSVSCKQSILSPSWVHLESILKYLGSMMLSSESSSIFLGTQQNIQ